MKGFTLYELILVMGITAILATVGTVNLLGFKRHQDLNITTNEIIELLRNAQYRSMVQEESSDWSIHFENPAGGRGYYDLFKGVIYDPNNVSARKQLRSGVEFVDPASGGGKNILFNRFSGTPTASNVVKIQLVNNPSSSSTITIGVNGKIEY